MLKLLTVLLIGLILACGMLTSCKKHINGPPDDTTHKCDTCNLNQDSLQKIKDSLAHAFVWAEYIDQLPGDGSPTGVWVFGPNDMIIVANSLWHFDGTTAKDILPIRNGSNTPMDGGLNGFSIFALSEIDYWLIWSGGSGNIAFHTSDGKHFDDMRPGLMNACWGTNSKDMFFVGNGGHIFHFDGIKFDSMNSNTTKNLRSVCGTSRNDVWACGYDDVAGETILTHYDGQSWQEDPISIQTGGTTIGGFDAVWACDSAGHKFVSTSGAILIRKTDNGLWRSDSGLIPNRLSDGSFIGIGPFGNSANDMMVLGPWGFIAHYNGKTWKKYDQFYNYPANNNYASAFSMNGNTACMVGVKDGHCWIAIGRRK